VYAKKIKGRLYDSVFSTAESLLSLKSVEKPLQIGAFSIKN